MINYKTITIQWLGHDGFRIEESKTKSVIYIDPFKLSEARHDATILLITHEHFDHLSPEDIGKVCTPETKIYAPMQCAQTARSFGSVFTMRSSDTQTHRGISISALPAYNTNKYRDPTTKTVFHPKTDEKIGYLIEVSGVRIYHAGDTDEIPEMENLRPDIALLPVSGTYVMTAEEAASAAKKIKPKIAIPMHYGTIVGTLADAERFAQLLSDTEIQVELLEKE